MFLPQVRVTCQDGDVNLDHVFVCGHPALDFAATLRARRSARFEMFVTPERLNANQHFRARAQHDINR